MNEELRARKKQMKSEQKKLYKERVKHHKDVLKKARANALLEKHCSDDVFISLQHIDKIYPNHVQAVYDFSLDIKQNEFIAFLGPSGCGKSTTLRMIAGLEEITNGDLFINGIYSNELLPKERNIGMVFQSYALYPHMSVYENMAFGLKIQHMSKEEIDERIHRVSKILQMEEYLDRKPAALSGGQCQRVALGRTMVTDSKIFLMDEPLSNLDAKLRVTMRSEIAKLHKALGITTIYVTHDQTEAMTMADRIVVMNKGVIQQIDTPEEIFNHPNNIFVATFIGSPAMNMLNVKIKDNVVSFENGHTLKLDAKLKNAITSFYEKAIKETEAEIASWKDEFLSREVNSRRYKKLFANDQLNKQKLVDYVSKMNEDVLLEANKETKVQFVDKINSKGELNDALKEYLFAIERIDNPNIIALVDKYHKLLAAQKEENKSLLLGIRPEHIIEDKNKESFPLKVNLTELLGSEYYIHLDFSTEKEILVKVDADKKIAIGDKMDVSFKKENIHIFDPITTKAIR